MMTKSIRKPTPADLASMLFLTIVWASAFIAIKVAVPQTGPVWLATMRTVLGFAVLLPWTLYRGLVLPHTPRSWGMLFLVSIFNVSLPFLLISWAELTISAGITSLLLATGPLLALVLSHVTTHDDKINLNKMIGIACGFSGIALVVGRDALDEVSLGTILSQLAVLGASLCYAISGAMIRKVTDIPPTRMATVILGMASLELLILGILDGVPDFTALSGDAWMSLLYLGVLPTGLATIMRYRLIQTVGASFFSLGMNLIPVFGVILGALLLAEVVALTTWIALMLILLGLAIARAPRRGKEQAASRA